MVMTDERICSSFHDIDQVDFGIFTEFLQY
jgi:hypothetical protein